MKILITGGTAFVSKAVAMHFVRQGYDVTVLNRNNHPQIEGVSLIEADRHDLKDKLEGKHFDAILDITAYDDEDITDLLNSGVSFEEYLLVSSSAVYPETNAQPFKEDDQLGPNMYWGKYGTDKIKAEKALLDLVKGAYILRPPYIYGPMDNVYREAFVFDCANQGRPFYLPKQGSQKLHFLYVFDLARIMETIIINKPEDRVLNVGNASSISIKDWVDLCYEATGNRAQFVEVNEDIAQRSYFCFYDYEYELATDLMKKLEIKLTDMKEGLRASYLYYNDHQNEVKKKDYIKFIDDNLR